MGIPEMFAELKRRRVFRVAVVYAAVGYVVLEAADLILPRLGVPEWALSLIVVLGIIGFLIAIALAWALELTPEGVKWTAPAAGPDGVPGAPRPLTMRRATALTLAPILIGGALGAGWFLRPAPDPASTGNAEAADVASKTIAVLPFDDLSQAKDQEWFSDGLTEEILNSLARLDEIRVTARNSSFQFKNRAVDVREVGRQLGVANVLEGSVRRAGDQLRITAQLIRAEDGFHLWSNTYDRHLDDVFAVQVDIAENIARVMDVYLDDARRERMVASGTRDPAAFLHYLRGRAAYNEAHRVGVGNTDLLWQANTWFERALEADPSYALARFYHHDAFSHAVMLDLSPSPEYRRADGSPDIARMQSLMYDDLDRALAEAGDNDVARSLAVVRHYNRGEWERLPRALDALQPDAMLREMEIAGGGWLWFPMMLMNYDEERAIEFARGRLQRDPLEVNAWSDLVILEMRAGRVQEAQRLLDDAAAVGLRHRYLDEAQVFVLLAAGRAQDVLRTHVARLDSIGVGWWAAAMAHAELGNAAEARAAIARAGVEGRNPERICWILARLGDQPAANECARAIDASPQAWVRFGRLIVDHGSVPFDPEAAPRFTAMFAATGATPYPRTTPAR